MPQEDGMHFFSEDVYQRRQMDIVAGIKVIDGKRIWSFTDIECCEIEKKIR